MKTFRRFCLAALAILIGALGLAADIAGAWGPLRTVVQLAGRHGAMGWTVAALLALAGATLLTEGRRFVTERQDKALAAQRAEHLAEQKTLQDSHAAQLEAVRGEARKKEQAFEHRVSELTDQASEVQKDRQHQLELVRREVRREMGERSRQCAADIRVMTDRLGNLAHGLNGRARIESHVQDKLFKSAYAHDLEVLTQALDEPEPLFDEQLSQAVASLRAATSAYYSAIVNWMDGSDATEGYWDLRLPTPTTSAGWKEHSRRREELGHLRQGFLDALSAVDARLHELSTEVIPTNAAPA